MELYVRFHSAFNKIFVFLLLAFGTLFSQVRPKIHSELIIRQKKASLLAYDYIPKTGGIAYVTYKSPHSTRYLALTITDPSFNPIATVTLPALSKTHYFYDLHIIGNLIWIFYVEEEGNFIKLLYHTYSIEGRVKTINQILIQTEKNRNKYFVKSLKFKKKRSVPSFLLILNPVFNPNDGEEEIIQAFFIREGKEQPEEVRITLPEKDLQLEFLDAALASNGDIFILTRFFPLPRKSSQVKLYHYLYHPKLLIDVPIAKDDQYQWLDVTMRLDTANFIYLSGFYGNERRSEVYGLFFYRISPISHEILVSQYIEIPDSVQDVYRGLWKKRNEGISSIYLDNSIITADGGIILLAERFYLSYEPYYVTPGYFYPYPSSYSYGTVVNYNYEDIFIFKLNQNGTLDWVQKITKFQSGESNESLSYNVFITPERLYFFYYTSTKTYGTNIYYVIMDTLGQITQPYPFFTRWHSTSIYFRKMALQISSHYALLVSYHRRKRSFVISKVYLP